MYIGTSSVRTTKGWTQVFAKFMQRCLNFGIFIRTRLLSSDCFIMQKISYLTSFKFTYNFARIIIITSSSTIFRKYEGRLRYTKAHVR